MGEARLRRSAEERQRIMDEALEAGASVAEVARRHEMNANLLFKWLREAGYGRRERKQAAGRAAIGTAGALEFVPLGVFTRDDKAGAAVTMAKASSPPAIIPSRPSLPATPRLEERAGVIELELADGTRVRVDAFVNEKALRRVLQAMKVAS